MPDPIDCPACGHADLTSGVIAGRSPGVKFKGSMGLAGDLTGVPLTTGIFNHSAPALRCEQCGTVVVLPKNRSQDRPAGVIERRPSWRSRS